MILSPNLRRFAAVAVLGCVVGTARGNPPEEEPPAELALDARVRVQRELPPEFFDLQVFQNQTAEQARSGLEKRLKKRLAEIDAWCELTPDQFEKLELAGRLDMKRLFDLIDSRRREFESRRTDPAAAGQLIQELEPLRNVYFLSPTSILFQECSLLHKSALTVLPPAQRVRYAAEMEAGRRSRRALVEKSVLKILGKPNPLDDDQRRELLELWTALPCVREGPMDAMVFLYQASCVPERTYRGILDERQWSVLQNRFAVARPYGLMLTKLGVIDDGEAWPQEVP